MTRPPAAARSRWLVLAVFVLSTAVNYLDRQTLATVAPLLRAEFHLSNAGYGLILTAFSVAYAASAPCAGLLIDRIGLSRAMSLAVGLWSGAGIATGLTRGLAGLAGCRAALGIAEAGGIPGAGKAIYQFLKPAERAVGNAMNQAGVSLGLMLAPPLATWLALRHGWRAAFVVTGALGLVWIPVWNWTARRAAAVPLPEPEAASGGELLRDGRLWAFVAGNALSMTGYSLWTNWTTLYLVDAQRLTLDRAKWYAAIPPLAALAGGLAGGWLSMRWIGRGMAAPAARCRACGAAAALALASAAIPLAPSAGWACAGIALGMFAVSAFSVNMYTLPLDVFGGAHAAFAVSILVASYGVAQAAVSPAFGKAIDLYGYGPVAVAAALAPLAAWLAIRRACREPARDAALDV